MPSNITLHFLQASRSIRTAWQMSDLGVDYKVNFNARNEKSQASPEAKKAVGALGKFPALEDNGVFYYESGSICEYLCDTYDKSHRLLPPVGDPQRYRVLQWVHASEATFMVHGLAILYARWMQQGGDVAATEEALSRNVVNDLNYLEAELGKSAGKFLFGDQISAADTMMHFSATFIFARQLGTKGQSWPKIEQWLKDCEDTPSYRAAVEKTGHAL